MKKDQQPTATDDHIKGSHAVGQEWEVRKQIRGWMIFAKDGSDVVDFLWLDEKYPTQIVNTHNAALKAAYQRGGLNDRR